MKSASDYALTPPETPAQGEQQRTGNAGGSCSAFSCPMAGSVQSGGRWWCRFHFGRDASVNDTVTITIKRNSPAVRFYHELLTLCHVDFEANREKYEQARFPLNPGESLIDYQTRVREWIDSRIREAITAKEQA